MKDLPGKAIYDFYFTPHRYQLFVHDQFGSKVEMPVSYYFRNLDTMPELEQVAIENCRGKTLDIGAAAGSHAIELQRKGIPVTALEISQNACKVMNERGVENVICEDFFKFSGQKFDTLLLLMNGIGISSTVDGLRKFFEKVDQLLLPNGQIIFDSCDIDYMYEEFQMPSDRYYGEVKCRYEYHELLTDWDESVVGDVFWAADSKTIYYTTAFRGTKQLFSLNPKTAKIQQITKGDFDVNEILALNKNLLLVTRTDINHNADLFSVDLKNGAMKQITDVNKDNYSKITPGKSELKMVKTTDGKEMGVWFHYPPNFDPNKNYPTLLYCQGGPQSALTQFFSTRWNFALMAANGYIVVAPNRRGMPGWGTQWNEEISKDWGGQPMRDYLAAADYAKTLPYVDGDRMGAVGASYGGYSVFMLAGIHNNRFKTFIAHDGLFDMKSWALTTEELWFANWDVGSPMEKPLPKAFTEFNPINFVDQWNKPMMIIQGGIDYRVPYEQGQEAFQAAKLHGLKAKFLYFPNENHWVLNAHNGLVWQREFFDWLRETL